MSLSFIVGNLRTGRKLVNLRVLSGGYSCKIGSDQTINASLDLRDPKVQKLDLRNTTRPTQTFLAAIEASPLGAVKKIMAAGPIWTKDWDEDAGQLTLNAKGMKSYFDFRNILPLLAASVDVTQFTTPDPSSTSASARIPNPALATTINDVSIGTIAKRLVAQARTWTGGDVPIVFQNDVAEAGRTKTYDGANFKTVGSALTDLMSLEDGTEFEFRPRFTADGKGVEWLLLTGTPSDPLIYDPRMNTRWNLDAAKPSAYGLKIKEDGSKMGSYAWFTGGSQTGSLLVSRASRSELLNSGYPLLEITDTSHSTVSLQSTLDNYARVAVAAGLDSTETWSFTAQLYPFNRMGNPSGPQITDYNVGDFVTLTLSSWDSNKKKGSLYVTGGPDHLHRIVGLSGSIGSDEVSIDCAPLIEDGN